MLTPEYLSGVADDLVELYSELDDLIVRDIVRRLVKAGDITETARWQAQKAQELGLLYEDVIKKVSQFSTASEAQIRQLFEDASVKALEFDCSIYEKVELSPVPLRQSESAARVLMAGISKTNGLLKNLTRTTAVSAQRTYIHAATIAEMQITSGAFDPHTAIRNAVNSAIREGVSILYPTGHRDRIDVAVRRAVVTGVSQTTGEISLQYARDMGCDLMELSAHFGARPSHAAWQGKIVSLSGRAGYLSLDEIGYGTGTGFKGWNCRHDWYPYFEGVSRRAYSEQRLKEYSDKKVCYNDEEIPYYEATQKQREMERKIREYRRRLAGYDEAIKKADKQAAVAIQADFDQAAVKLKQQEEVYRDFANQTGLSRQNDRIQVSGFGRSLSQRAVQAAKKQKALSFTNSTKAGIIKTRGDIVGIDLKIDHFTSCLEDSKTGKLVETSYKIASKSELSKLKGWNFNWLSKDLNECEIYKLTTVGNDNIQGLIALTGISKDNSVYVSLVESAPQNLGRSKAFYGVGGHLYAIAAQRSVELGYGGFFYMDAKNMELVAHYQDTLGAVLLGRPHPYRMFVDEENAKKLIKIYTLKEEP